MPNMIIDLCDYHRFLNTGQDDLCFRRSKVERASDRIIPGLSPYGNSAAQHPATVPFQRTSSLATSAMVPTFDTPLTLEMLPPKPALGHTPTFLPLPPTLGLAPVILDQLSKVLGMLHEPTPTRVLVGEQNVGFALLRAAPVYVLERARIVWENDPERFAASLGSGQL
jgi:hypothetical protein